MTRLTITPAPTPAQAAAIAAAVQATLVVTAGPEPPHPGAAWRRRARYDGVAVRAGAFHEWGLYHGRRS